MPLKVFISIVVLIIALVLPQHPMAQSKVIILPTNADHQIEYLETITVNNTSQSILFKRALNWVVGTKCYKFTKIDLLDNTFGRILASARLQVDPDEVFISLNMDVKDNRVRLKVTRFDYNMQPGNIPLDNLTNKSKEAKGLIPKVHSSMQLLLKDFRGAMILSAAKG